MLCEGEKEEEVEVEVEVGGIQLPFDHSFIHSWYSPPYHSTREGGTREGRPSTNQARSK